MRPCARSSGERHPRSSWCRLLRLSSGEFPLTGAGASLPKVTSGDARLRRRYTAFCGRLLRPSILAFGDYTYESKGVVGQTEYELRVDAETEEILKEDSENNDYDDDGYLSFGNLITPAEAIRIAQERINTDASAFEGWKLDNNDDHGNAPVYEVEFQGHDAEVKIHAETGEVLGVDG